LLDRRSSAPETHPELKTKRTQGKPNQRIQLTGRATLPPRGILLLQRGLQLILGRSAEIGSGVEQPNEYLPIFPAA
jgi:hypothetical protein